MSSLYVLSWYYCWQFSIVNSPKLSSNTLHLIAALLLITFIPSFINGMIILNHLHNAMNCASVVLSVVPVRILDSQVTRQPANLTMYPVLDFVVVWTT